MIEASRTAASEAETRLIGRALGALLRAGDVVLLEGTLGAGKTTLVRAVAEGLGLPGAGVASPTFVLVHEYERPEGAALDRPALIHVDGYRLRAPGELDSLGWDAVLTRLGQGGDAALVVEWPERLGPGAVEGFASARVCLEHAGEGARVLHFSLPDSWCGRAGLEALLARQPALCPVTGEPVHPDSPTYPFSSERARLADLHRWFSGGYTISREVRDSDLEE